MITAIIQARVSSTRFPNKVFASLSGKPLIWHVVDRLRWSRKIEKIVLATTINPADDALESWATQNGIVFFRGSEEDVLARFFGASTKFHASTIVRITADDPFKDPRIIDTVIRLFQEHRLDFAYNNKPPSFPEGNDIEVFSFSALALANREARDPFEREHVTQYFYRHPEIFRQMNYAYTEDLSTLRWTIDTTQDFLMATEVYEQLYQKNRIFLMEDILALLEKNPRIKKINWKVERSVMFKK